MDLKNNNLFEILEKFHSKYSFIFKYIYYISLIVSLISIGIYFFHISYFPDLSISNLIELAFILSIFVTIIFLLILIIIYLLLTSKTFLKIAIFVYEFSFLIFLMILSLITIVENKKIIIGLSLLLFSIFTLIILIYTLQHKNLTKEHIASFTKKSLSNIYFIIGVTSLSIYFIYRLESFTANKLKLGNYYSELILKSEFCKYINIYNHNNFCNIKGKVLWNTGKYTIIESNLSNKKIRIKIPNEVIIAEEYIYKK